MTSARQAWAGYSVMLIETGVNRNKAPRFLPERPAGTTGRDNQPGNAKSGVKKVFVSTVKTGQISKKEPKTVALET